ncbi:MAG: hypothetical protein ACM3VT_21670, partial [Solirubrobacterales bacterium]
WDKIHEPLRDPLARLIEGLQAKLGRRVESLTVVGSALTEDFRPGISDINTVVMLDEHDIEALKAVALLARSMRRSGLSAPLLMTTSHIERSRDVFGVEFLDFQLTHETILGDDPFAAVALKKQDVRLQCERELKAMLVRLRQGWIAACGDERLIRDLLISAAKGLVPLLRAMLWLKDVERPRAVEAAFREAAERFGVELDAVVTAQRWRYASRRLSSEDVNSTFVAVVGSVDRLAATIDKIEL